MPRREQEAVIPPPNAHVVGEVHADPVNTGSRAAFAENPDSVASKRIVDVTQELLILGLPSRSLDRRISHGSALDTPSRLLGPGPTGGKLIADTHREPAKHGDRELSPRLVLAVQASGAEGLPLPRSRPLSSPRFRSRGVRGRRSRRDLALRRASQVGERAHSVLSACPQPTSIPAPRAEILRRTPARCRRGESWAAARRARPPRPLR